MTYKEYFGAISVALIFVGYVPYFWSIFKKQTKPHMFSWITWGTVNGIVFYGQYTNDAGAGAWVTGATAVLCFIIVGISAACGEKNITRSDWLVFIGALATIPLWYFTKNPLGAVVLATIIDLFGCYPTLRKSYIRPYEETVSTWAIATIRTFISLFALEHYSLVTLIFPISTVFATGAITSMLLWRRASLRTLRLLQKKNSVTFSI